MLTISSHTLTNILLDTVNKTADVALTNHIQLNGSRHIHEIVSNNSLAQIDAVYASIADSDILDVQGPVVVCEHLMCEY